MNTFTRRDVLRAGALGALACALPRNLRAAPVQKVGISVQLYSVRDLCGKDFPGTLKQIAALGFEGAELAGYYDKSAAELRKLLDGLGLKAAATHIGAKTLEGDELKRTIEFHKTLGCNLLICPGDGRFTNADKSKELAEVFNKATETLKPLGMACGYHNHTHEFEKGPGGKTWWDLFAERTSKEVVLQIDFGHAIYAGVDCVGLIRRNPGRIRTTHVKGRIPAGVEGKKPFVGQDTGDWKAILGACYEVGGTEWFSIEQEDYPDGKSSIDCVKISLDGLKGILKGMGK